MKITDVRVRRITKEGKLKAVVSITIEDEFVVHDIKVIEGSAGLFIAMPSRRTQDGEFKDIVHPIHSAFREVLSEAILEKYHQAMFEYEQKMVQVVSSVTSDSFSENVEEALVT